MATTLYNPVLCKFCEDGENLQLHMPVFDELDKAIKFAIVQLVTWYKVFETDSPELADKIYDDYINSAEKNHYVTFKKYSKDFNDKWTLGINMISV